MTTRVQPEMPKPLPIPPMSTWLIRRNDADGGDAIVEAHRIVLSPDRTTVEFRLIDKSYWSCVREDPKTWKHNFQSRPIALVRNYKSITEQHHGGDDGDPE